MKEALTRPAYTEIDTLNMLAHCRSAGLGIDQAIKFFVAKTPVKELRALKDGEDHPDAKPDDDKPCERCPYKPDDDAPESADKSAKATTSWDAAVSRVNANIAGGVTASAAPTGAGQVTISLPQDYSVADALRTIETCILAGASMREARQFIIAGTPIAEVRATLLAKRAEASEPEIDSHHAAKSGTEAADGWNAAVNAVNKTLEP